MENLKDQLLMIRYQKRENKVHEITGIVKDINESHVAIEDQDGTLTSVEHKSIDKVSHLLLIDEKMRDYIREIQKYPIFIEYKTSMNLIRTVGSVRKIYLHCFEFQSRYETEISMIHYDSIIQVDKEENMKGFFPENLIL